MFTIFIDGAEGTTGLEIHKRLKNHKGIKLIEIPSEKRKDLQVKKDYLNNADLVILCLPDDAARESVSLISNEKTRIIDASTAFRTSADWVYGLPELTKNQRELIKNAKKVANPGCYATGFILLIRPLIEMNILSEDAPLSCFAVSGYSGGGKKLIAAYETTENSASILGSRFYALHLNHKHLPEMKMYSKLKRPPLFLPVVGAYYKGMIVTVPIHSEFTKGNIDLKAFNDIYMEYYKNEPFVKVKPAEDIINRSNGYFNPVECNNTNYVDIFVFTKDNQCVVAARFDNLGKGASGAAVQNMNIMLGIDEKCGLV